MEKKEKDMFSKLFSWFKEDDDEIISYSEKKLILVIDDQVDLANLMKYALEAKGYHVILAYNGLEGLEKLKKIKPDLIILDVHMPQMGGLEFYSRISTGHGHSKYPVLILTSRDDLEETFREIEVAGFMPKPFEVDHLAKEVDRITSSLKKPVVFLIDYPENPRAQEIKKVFENEGYQVVPISDYVQMEEQGQLQEPQYIVMEYMQKDISGEKLIHKIKLNPLFFDVPIIVYTYSGFLGYGERALNAGADKYLSQPKEYDVFIKAVKELELKKKGKLDK